MAFLNFSVFLVFLSQMSNVDFSLLKENEKYLLLALSHLFNGEFERKKCADAINKIEKDFFKNIGLKDEKEIKKFCGDIFIILKTKWQKFK